MKHYRFFHAFALFLAICLTFSMVTPVQAASYKDTDDSASAVSWPSGPSVTAESAIVMELSTGTVLYEKNAKDKKFPASITKVMTALLAVENSSMDEIVEYSEAAVYGNGPNSSSIGMNIGEKLSMEDSMYGMMLASGNEVAKAIGEHVGGSLTNFVDMMNDRAAELGCVNTHFANPNGLHDDNHYTCAYDMALIDPAAAKNSTFRKIAGTRVHVIPPTEMMEEDRWVANSHQMVNPAKYPQYAYEDRYAGKTGFTNEARYTLVTFAKRGNLDVVSVIMHAQMQVDQYEDTITLLDYVFDNFSTHTISKLDNAPAFDNFSLFTRFSPLFDMENAPLSIDTGSFVVLPNGASYSNVEQSITYHDLTSIKKGSNVIGQVSYQYGDKTVGYTDILYESTENFSFETEKTNADGTDGSTRNSDGVSTNGEKNGGSAPASVKNGSKSNLKPWIMAAIVIFLAFLGLLYYMLIELPHQRRRRAFYEKRRKRREQESYLDL